MKRPATFAEMRALLPRQLKVDQMGPLTVPLHGLHSMALAFGEERFAQKGDCPPTYLVAVRTNVLWLEAAGEEWGEWEARLLTYAFMRHFLQVSGAHAYSFLSEAFVAVYPGKKLGDDIVMPLDLPDSERDEILMVTSYAKAGDCYFSRYLITPSRRPGKLAWLGPRIDESAEDASAMAGAAFNLFQPAKPVG